MNIKSSKSPSVKNLVNAMRKITSRLDIDNVLGQIVRALTDDLGGTYAAVWIVGQGDTCDNCDIHHECLDKENCLHLKAWSGDRGASPNVRERVPVGVMNIGAIGLSRSPYVINGLYEDPMILDKEWASSLGISSFAGFPLLNSDDSLLGVMAYFSEKPISGELGDMLYCLAHQSAMALVDAEAHRTVRESEERYRALIDGAIDAVFILGPGGRILAASRTASRQLGYSNDELISMSFDELDHSSFTALKDSYPDLLAGETVTYSGNFVMKSGELLPVEVKAGATIYNGDTAIQAFVRDMSDRVKMERHKADVVSMLTHDLKGPISIVMGYTEVIKDQYSDQLPEFVKEGVDAIYRGGDKLLSLVNDYLSLSKLESGILSMHKYPTDIKKLIERALETVSFIAAEKGLHVSVEHAGDIPDIEIDPSFMERAITNLLSNAVNYTPRGGSIRVGCSMTDGGKSVEVFVSDTGVGIPIDELPMVFDKYFRASGTGVKGTGLGLAIVKSVTEGHGGKVEADSEEGKGSTFRITVPVS